MLNKWKDIAIGFFVACMVTDLLLVYAAKTHHPGLFKGLQRAMGDENYCLILVIGIASGILAYYLSSKTKDF